MRAWESARRRARARGQCCAAHARTLTEVAEATRISVIGELIMTIPAMGALKSTTFLSSWIFTAWMLCAYLRDEECGGGENAPKKSQVAAARRPQPPIRQATCIWQPSGLPRPYPMFNARA